MEEKIEFSDYQLEICDAIENSSSNIAINAVAGSGKTTTIVEACKRLGENERNVIFLAFNNHIVDKLKVELKGFARASTLHSLGFSVLKSLYNFPEYGMKVKVDDWKYRKYVSENVFSLSSLIKPDTDPARVYGFCCNVSKLFSLARVNLIRHNDQDLS